MIGVAIKAGFSAIAKGFITIDRTMDSAYEQVDKLANISHFDNKMTSARAQAQFNRFLAKEGNADLIAQVNQSLANRKEELRNQLLELQE